jgi:hypothetical protein
MIPCLRVDAGKIDDQKETMAHIYQFYSGLMGSAGEERAFSLAPDLWDELARISLEENLALEVTFTPEEMDEVLSSMKIDSAPGDVGITIRVTNIALPLAAQPGAHEGTR